MNRLDEIYNKVLNAMQEADELGGIEDPRQYQNLMQRIENTARVRFYNSVDLERENNQLNEIDKRMIFMHNERL